VICSVINVSFLLQLFGGLLCVTIWPDQTRSLWPIRAFRADQNQLPQCLAGAEGFEPRFAISKLDALARREMSHSEKNEPTRPIGSPGSNQKSLLILGLIANNLAQRIDGCGQAGGGMGIRTHDTEGGF
jgi:hypothetical protein